MLDSYTASVLYKQGLYMRNLIKRNLNGKKILMLFILTSIVYTIMLTITVPKVMSFSGGMKLLDMIPTGYDSSNCFWDQ
jgi:hypothetical protein